MKRVVFAALVLSLLPASALKAKDYPDYFVSDGRIFAKSELRSALTDLNSNTVQKSLKGVKEISDALQKKGIQLVVAFIPGRVNLYPIPEDVRAEIGETAPSYQAAQAWFRANGVTTANLLEQFRTDLPLRHDLELFYRYDIHWTPLGAISAATAISKVTAPVQNQIKTTSVLSAPRVRTTAAFRDKLTPLPTNLPVEMDATLTTSLPPVGLLDDERPAEVVLVGTSFSGYGTVPALNHALHTEILNMGISGRGMWFPMTQYLSSEQWKTQKPRVVIWEFPELILTTYPTYTPEEIEAIRTALK